MKSIMRSLAAAALLSAGAAQAAPVQWSAADGGNDHWYELVVESVSWTDARDAAAGSSWQGVDGYLATITSAEEQAFLNSFVPNGARAWLGGSDMGQEGRWEWVDGPEAGTTFWHFGTIGAYENWEVNEPNNAGGGEGYLIGWWRADRWNDLPDVTTKAFAYVVEYSGTSDSGVAPVPVPPALPLMAAGLLALSALRRRR